MSLPTFSAPRGLGWAVRVAGWWGMVGFVVCRWRRAGSRALAVAAVATFSIVASSAFASAASRVAASASTEIDNWNSFYANDIEAAYRFLGAFIIIAAALSASSGLVSGIFVGVSAVEWKPNALLITRVLGPVLILTAAALVPLYAMFHPFEASDVVHIWAWAVSVGLYAAMFALFFWSQQGTWYRSLNRAVLRSWWPFLLSLVTISVTCAILWFFGLNHAQPRLVMSYVALLLLGVIATSVSYGQSRRIQIDARAGKGKAERDEASTEYLLARIKTLGLEQPRSLHIARNSKALSALTSTDLSATPAGQIASTIARVASALRPGLAWHATVTFVDNGRLAMTLSRNGRLAAADAFSRQDVSLSPIDEADQDSIDRAHAQLLTGAAAFVLLELGNVYPHLKEGLCGATRWRSIALQVIASSRSLSGDAENQIALLRSATNLDPDNAIAQYEYIRALTTEYEPTEFSESTANRLDELRRQIMTRHDPPKAGYEGLALRILYDSAVSWLTIAARSPVQQRGPHLGRAKKSVRLLIGLCDSPTVASGKDLSQIAEILKREADCLRLTIKAFECDVTDERPKSARRTLSPVLAYNYACFEARRLTSLGAGDPRRERVLDLLFRDLAFAVSTQKSKECARTDPFFGSVRADPRFIALVERTAFLDLAPYKRFAPKLAGAGFDSAPLFAAANASPQQREETAKYLEVPSATIERMYQIAAIGRIAPELAEPGMLYLLLRLDIDSAERLRAEITRDVDDFLARLRDTAAACGLADLPGAAMPDGWVRAVKILAGTNGTNGTSVRGRRWSMTVARFRIDGAMRAAGNFLSGN